MKTCCFIGHRDMKETPELKEELIKTVLNLIEEHGVREFLFGSKSSFDNLCLKTVTEIKEKYTDIKLIYYRSSYPNIDSAYKAYLLKSYDDTLMPSGIERAGKASYLERNQKMIDKSDFCVFYYNKDYLPKVKNSKELFARVSKSGTKVAYEYAEKKSKLIINLYK